MTTAQTILAQIGGNRFLAMTGAKNLIGDNSMLRFDLPRGAAKNKANKVQITLEASDTYRVDFIRYDARKLECQTVGTVSDVYADNLRDVFTAATGLYCTL